MSQLAAGLTPVTIIILTNTASTKQRRLQRWCSSYTFPVPSVGEPAWSCSAHAPLPQSRGSRWPHICSFISRSEGKKPGENCVVGKRSGERSSEMPLRNTPRPQGTKGVTREKQSWANCPEPWPQQGPQYGTLETPTAIWGPILSSI